MYVDFDLVRGNLNGITSQYQESEENSRELCRINAKFPGVIFPIVNEEFLSNRNIPRCQVENITIIYTTNVIEVVNSNKICDRHLTHKG